MTDDTDAKEISMGERTELFLVQTRGTIATAFNHAGVAPSQEEWDVIRGLCEPTMRQIAEIGCRTGFNMYVNISDRVKP